MVQGRRFSTHYIFQSNLGINKSFEHFRLKGIVVKVIILINFFLVTGSLTAQKSINKGYPIQPVPFSQVKITDRFWAPRIEINRKVTLLLNGIGILHFMGEQINKRVAQSGILTKTNLTAIPYYAWAHRGTGSMAVWIPERISNK